MTVYCISMYTFSYFLTYRNTCIFIINDDIYYQICSTEVKIIIPKLKTMEEKNGILPSECLQMSVKKSSNISVKVKFKIDTMRSKASMSKKKLQLIVTLYRS